MPTRQDAGDGHLNLRVFAEDDFAGASNDLTNGGASVPVARNRLRGFRLGIIFVFGEHDSYKK
jgi:hypothetical protein